LPDAIKIKFAQKRSFERMWLDETCFCEDKQLLTGYVIKFPSSVHYK